MRQSEIIRTCDPKRGVCVATLAYEYPRGVNVPEHAHGSDQLLYAIRGVMEVSVGHRAWLVPPHFALWIPARTRHRIHMPGPVSMRTLYFRPGLVAKLPPESAVLHVAPLLREMIVETVRMGRLRTRKHEERALRDLLISRIERASPVPTFITLPKDPRALAVAQVLLKSPGHSETLAVLGSAAGVSVKTIERAFHNDVGMSFRSWRSQVRLMKAIELLIAGSPVKEVAFAVGYLQPSAFVNSFRKTLGSTPKAWCTNLKKLDS